MSGYFISGLYHGLYSASKILHSLCVPRLRQSGDLVIVLLGGEVVHLAAVRPHDRDLPLRSQRGVRLKKTDRGLIDDGPTGFQREICTGLG